MHTATACGTFTVHVVDTQRQTAVRAPDDSGWSSLFWEAFKRSRNPMVLLDDNRRHVEVNGAYLQLLGYPRQQLIGHPVYEFVADGPIASESEWRAALSKQQFTGIAELLCQDGRRVKVEYAGHPELVTGRKMVLFVALRSARGVRRLQSDTADSAGQAPLSGRELEVIELIAMGLSGPEIAHELHVAHNTVRTHVRNAMTKTGSRSRAHLVAKSVAEGACWERGI